MSIRYSVRYVQQGRYQGLSLFDAAFDLTWLTCLSSENGHLPGTLRSPVQITCASRLYGEGIGLAAIQQLLGHRWLSTTVRYVHVADEAIEHAYQQAAERAAARFKEV